MNYTLFLRSQRMTLGGEIMGKGAGIQKQRATFMTWEPIEKCVSLRKCASRRIMLCWIEKIRLNFPLCTSHPLNSTDGTLKCNFAIKQRRKNLFWLQRNLKRVSSSPAIAQEVSILSQWSLNLCVFFFVLNAHIMQKFVFVLLRFLFISRFLSAREHRKKTRS